MGSHWASAIPPILLRDAASLEETDRLRISRVRSGGSETSAADAHLRPEELLVAAKIAVNATATAEQVAEAIDAAERRVRSFVPISRVIYLEPDLLRSKARPR